MNPKSTADASPEQAANYRRIRPAKLSDLDRIMEIYAGAQEFMIRSGNPTQWGHFHPTRSLLEADIRQKRCFVLTEAEVVHAVFVLLFDEEPTYQVIEDGAWFNHTPYVTIHRIAGDGLVHGVFRSAADFCLRFSDHLRVDTHADNLPMQRSITAYGFRRCGIIHIADGTPRIAYEYVSPAIRLEPMTREWMHEMYRDFVCDPAIFMDPELFERAKQYRYDAKKTDQFFDMRSAEPNSLCFAVLLEEEVIGEIGLRHIREAQRECELSVHLKNDSVKNRGYGTQAERLMIRFAFKQLDMHTVTADSLLQNTRSRHVLERLGFRPVGEEDGFMLYRLDRDDWDPIKKEETH